MCFIFFLAEVGCQVGPLQEALTTTAISGTVFNMTTIHGHTPSLSHAHDNKTTTPLFLSCNCWSNIGRLNWGTNNGVPGARVPIPAVPSVGQTEQFSSFF